VGKSNNLISWLQVGPLALVLLIFFGIPMTLIVVVSFSEYSVGEVIFNFTLENYREILTSPFTYNLYANTIKYTLIVLAISLVIGFWVSYFLVFHIRSLGVKIFFFLLCTIPFWTSVIIRMISWIPILGREGVINGLLMDSGLIAQPLDFLLYSDFSVIVAYVHLYTLFMIVPIFNSMARIDNNLLVAAEDSGATPWQVLWNVIIPLCKNGIALGSIFVITLVMGDFFVVTIMSGGQKASVVSALSNEVASLQYPPAAANAVILVLFVSVIIATILRIVDVRKELAS